MIDITIKKRLQSILEDAQLENKVYNWHKQNNFYLLENLIYVISELEYHFELSKEIKAEILTNIEFLATFEIRKQSLNILPKDWINLNTKQVDNEKLDELWLQPERGYLIKILEKSEQAEDKIALDILLNGQAVKYRGLDKNTEDRKILRLEKLQKSVQDNKIVIFLGRQNRVYQILQANLNAKYVGKFHFVSDHTWSANGYTERAMKTSDSRLSVIQACETIFRLPTLNLQGGRINDRFIMFTLDSYDAKGCLAAIYSDSNRIARNYTKPKIENITDFEFAYTGLTDLELANIVRNKNWFDLTKFCKTNENGELEELTSEQVKEEYGIKFIGNRL